MPREITSINLGGVDCYLLEQYNFFISVPLVPVWIAIGIAYDIRTGESNG